MTTERPELSEQDLVLKAHSIGVDAAFVPIVLIFMHLVYAAAACWQLRLPMPLQKDCGVQLSASTIWLLVLRPSSQTLPAARYGQLSAPARLSASAVW